MEELHNTIRDLELQALDSEEQIRDLEREISILKSLVRDARLTFDQIHSMCDDLLRGLA